MFLTGKAVPTVGPSTTAAEGARPMPTCIMEISQGHMKSAVNFKRNDLSARYGSNHRSGESAVLYNKAMTVEVADNDRTVQGLVS